MKDYNKARHLELLKIKYTGMLSQENDFELSKYSVILNSHLDWESRQTYLDLLEDLKTQKIKYFKFCIDFETRGKLISEVTRILESNFILLSPHEKSFGFSDLLEKIFDLCSTKLEETQETYSSEIEFQNFLIEVQNLEIELQNDIEKTYSQIQKYLDE